MNPLDPQIAMEAAEAEVFNHLRAGERAVVVDSPPGAGKTGLVEDVAVVCATTATYRVGVVAPNNSQTQEIARRIGRHFQDAHVCLLVSAQQMVAPDLEGLPNVRVVRNARDLPQGNTIVVSTAHRIVASNFPTDIFDLLVCDEAYQLPYNVYGPLYHLAKQHVLVGDPGQLPPLVIAEIDRFEAGRHRVHWAAPRELLRRQPDVPRIRLPISRRLPRDTVEIIQPSLYPDLPFTSAARDADRWIGFGAPPRTIRMDRPQWYRAANRALEILQQGKSIVALMLPQRTLAAAAVDEELAQFTAFVIDLILRRQAAWLFRGLLAPSEIGCLDSHVASGDATRRVLRTLGYATTAATLRVDTPETWQGLERPLTVVKHPLSGLDRLDAFSLDPGRWCVMLSRHQLGCIVVGRDGIGENLERHTHSSADRPMGAVDTEWTGWDAHRRIWSNLEQGSRIIHVA